MVTAVARSLLQQTGPPSRAGSSSQCLGLVGFAVDNQLRLPVEGAATVPAGVTPLATVSLAVDDQLRLPAEAAATVLAHMARCMARGAAGRTGCWHGLQSARV